MSGGQGPRICSDSDLKVTEFFSLCKDQLEQREGFLLEKSDVTEWLGSQ